MNAVKRCFTAGIATTNAELVQGFDTFQISQEYKVHRVHRVFFCACCFSISPNLATEKRIGVLFQSPKKEKGKQTDRLKNKGKLF